MEMQREAELRDNLTREEAPVTWVLAPQLLQANLKPNPTFCPHVLSDTWHSL